MSGREYLPAVAALFCIDLNIYAASQVSEPIALNGIEIDVTTLANREYPETKFGFEAIWLALL
ncbi:MAG TPA: hypothetical protein PK395_10755 [bacterium]|nr:hypothetical protein [bacterium]